MRQVAVYFNAAANGVAVNSDRDTQLLAVVSLNGSRMLASWDSTDTIASISTPASSVDFNSRIIMAVNGFVQLPFPVDVRKGESVFISAGGAGSCLLIFNDLS